MLKRLRLTAPAVVMALMLSACAVGAADKEGAGVGDGFVDAFEVKKENFASVGRNDYFILEPGHQLTLEGKDDGEPAELVITVLDETKEVEGVETRIVEERESVGGKVVEISRNYFAIDKTTGDIYYFGEDVDDYTDGKITGHSGKWLSGKDGARFGLFIPAKAAVGQKFYQEVAPKVAMDRCEVVSVSEKVKVPAGTFENCVKVKETTPIEPDTVEHKLYAPGVGLLTDGPLKLVKHGQKKAAARGGGKPGTGKQAKAAEKPAGEPIIPNRIAREALNYVGADPEAESVWVMAINDPALPGSQRSDLIEDLNENGFVDPKNVTPDEMPLVLSRLALIEELAPDAMDEVNAAAFAEAYKDLANIANRLAQ